MADNIFDESVDMTGSSPDAKPGPVAAGQPAAQAAEKNYEELEKKLGSQGKELGEYREFVKNLTPLLNKLDAQPELVNAILAGKIDQSLVKAALEGKVTVADATAVTEAQKQVEKELGKKITNMTQEDIEKLVEERFTALRGEISEKESLKEFEDKTAEFIAGKPDFEKHASDVAKWLEDHPNQDDIETAYYAVVGMQLKKAVDEGDSKKVAELAKDLALANVSGGSAPSATVTSQEDLADMLIASRPSANLL